jgi:MHS family citrate/tricarballylate:H+ symporter-like MFS transporter
MTAWGWRIPLFIGCLIIPFVLLLRRNLEESDEFIARARHPSIGEILRSLASHSGLVLIGLLLFTMTTISFYMITAYTPTFGSSVLHLSSRASFIVTFCVGASNLFWLPVMGHLSDRIGRFPLLFACTVLMIVSAYPAMLWLVAGPSFTKLLAVELWFSFVYGSYNGALIVFMTEFIPIQIRTTGFSLAYSMATAIFGGFTPAICTYLIHLTGNRAIPGLWLSFAAICGLGAALAARFRKTTPATNYISPVTP